MIVFSRALWVRGTSNFFWELMAFQLVFELNQYESCLTHPLEARMNGDCDFSQQLVCRTGPGTATATLPTWRVCVGHTRVSR